MNLQEQISRMKSMMGVINESQLPIHIRRRVTIEELDDLVNQINDLIDLGYSRTNAMYGALRRFIDSNEELSPNLPEGKYWDSYIMIEKPLVDYIKQRV